MPLALASAATETCCAWAIDHSVSPGLTVIGRAGRGRAGVGVRGQRYGRRGGRGRRMRLPQASTRRQCEHLAGLQDVEVAQAVRGGERARRDAQAQRDADQRVAGLHDVVCAAHRGPSTARPGPAAERRRAGSGAVACRGDATGLADAPQRVAGLDGVGVAARGGGGVIGQGRESEQSARRAG